MLHVAWMELPFETRLAVCHNDFPAAMSVARVDGGCQVVGSSCTKVLASISCVPPGARKLKFNTRKPLVTPSVPLNLKLTVLAPETKRPSGTFKVSFSVENPPPMPP